MLVLVILLSVSIELPCEARPRLQHTSASPIRRSLFVQRQHKNSSVQLRRLCEFLLAYVSASHLVSPSSSLLTDRSAGLNNDRQGDILMLAKNLTRREVAKGAVGMLGAEAGWRQAVATANDMQVAGVLSNNGILPEGAAAQIRSGRAVVVEDWLPIDMSAALLNDAKACFEGGDFRQVKPDYYWDGTESEKAQKNNRWIYPELWNRPDVPASARSLRYQLRDRIAKVKVLLASQLNRSTILEDSMEKTHEVAYTRYFPGAEFQRHVDEKHLELMVPFGAKDPKVREAYRGDTSRRSISYIIYLNDQWNAKDGGELRIHQRAQPSVAQVGARGPDLQIGWLRATKSENEQPVFLDAMLPRDGDCMLYTVDRDGSKRQLSAKPFSNEALYYPGGDKIARQIMIDDPADANRFHLTDCARSPDKTLNPVFGDMGEDGGELVRDIAPLRGTLVLFDSVAVPHEVLVTNRDRWALTGWFHERLLGAA